MPSGVAVPTALPGTDSSLSVMSAWLCRTIIAKHWTALIVDSERFLKCLLVSGLCQLAVAGNPRPQKKTTNLISLLNSIWPERPQEQFLCTRVRIHQQVKYLGIFMKKLLPPKLPRLWPGHKSHPTSIPERIPRLQQWVCTLLTSPLIAYSPTEVRCTPPAISHPLQSPTPPWETVTSMFF